MNSLGQPWMHAGAMAITRANPNLWAVTPHYISKRRTEYSIQMNYKPSCSAYRKALKSKYELRESMHGQLDKLCTNKINLKWLPALEKAEAGKPKQDNAWARPDRSSRFKRIALFVPLLAIFVVMVIVSAITTSYVVLDQRQTEMNETLTKTREDIDVLKGALIKSTMVADSLNDRIRDAIDNAMEMERATKDLAIISADAMWATAIINNGIDRSIDALNAIEKSCRLNSELNVGVFLTLIDPEETRSSPAVRELVDIKDAKTAIKKIERVEGGAVNFTFSVEMEDNSTKVYRVEAFDIFVNVTSDPKLVKYSGPRFLIHNSQLNCTRGIREPSPYQIPVYEACNIPNYIDPRLQRWTATGDGPNEENQVHQIKKNNHQSFIYCLYGNTTVGNELIECPPFVMGMSLEQSFRTDFYEHTTRVVELNSTNIIPSITMTHLNSTMTSEAYNEQVGLLQVIKKKNIEIRAMLEDKKEPVTIDYGVVAVGIIGLLVCILFLVLLCKKGSGPSSQVVNNFGVSPTTLPGTPMPSSSMPLQSFHPRVELPQAVAPHAYESVPEKLYYEVRPDTHYYPDITNRLFSRNVLSAQVEPLKVMTITKQN